MELDELVTKHVNSAFLGTADVLAEHERAPAAERVDA